jgi:hypothetical protein
MWWWIGGAAAYLAIALYFAYGVARKLHRKYPDDATMVVLTAAGSLLWPATLLFGIAIVWAELGIKHGKRTDAKSADKSA